MARDKDRMRGTLEGVEGGDEAAKLPASLKPPSLSLRTAELLLQLIDSLGASEVWTGGSTSYTYNSLKYQAEQIVRDHGSKTK